jgi:hypothetical protein
VYQWIDGHRSEKVFKINCRYYQSKIKKSLTDGSITLMKMRPKVLIDSFNRYHRYQSIADCAHIYIGQAGLVLRNSATEAWDWSVRTFVSVQPVNHVSSFSNLPKPHYTLSCHVHIQNNFPDCRLKINQKDGFT